MPKNFLDDKPPVTNGSAMLIVGEPMTPEEHAAKFVGTKNWAQAQLVIFEGENGEFLNAHEFPAGIDTIAKAEAYITAIRKMLR